MRFEKSFLGSAFFLFAVGCGVQEPPRDPGPAENPENLVQADIETAAAEPSGCPFDFGSTFAIETYSSVRLPPSGGVTDYASVVTVIAHSTIEAPLAIRYETHAGDCAGVSFSQAVLMVDVGREPEGEGYTGVIPSFPRGTHVCWKVAAEACGTTIAIPLRGSLAFDYTTD